MYNICTNKYIWVILWNRELKYDIKIKRENLPNNSKKTLKIISKSRVRVGKKCISSFDLDVIHIEQCDFMLLIDINKGMSRTSFQHAEQRQTRLYT